MPPGSDLSVSHNKIGEGLVAHGNLPEALAAPTVPIPPLPTAWRKADPGNADWQHDLAFSHAKVGSMLARRAI